MAAAETGPGGPGGAHATGSRKDAPVIEITGDRPVQERDQDRFGWHRSFVPQLTRVVQEWPARDGVTVALYGSWGAGKTSVLNLLASDLRANSERHPHTYVMRFDPWFYEDGRSLVRSFFNTLAASLAEAGETPWRPAADALRTIGTFLAAGLRGASPADPAPAGATSAGRRTDATLSGEQALLAARQTVETALSELAGAGGRCIMLVDDIDRLDQAGLVALMRLLGMAGHLPATTLVLAMDEDRVRELLAGAGYGRAFLEKIIQVQLHVPVPDAGIMDALLQAGIREVLETGGLAVPAFLVQERKYRALTEMGLLTSLIETPRDLARYLNGLRTLVLSQEERDLYSEDAINLAAVQVFFPDVFDRIRRRKAFLTESEVLAELLGREEDVVARRERELDWIIHGGRPTLSRRDEEVARRLMRDLFGDIVQRHRDRTREEAVARRIRSAEAFDNYFAYAQRPGTATRQEVAALLDSIAEAARSGSQQALESLITHEIGDIDSVRTRSLLRDLHVRFRELPGDVLPTLGGMLVRSLGKLPGDGATQLLLALLDAAGSSPYDAVWRQAAAGGTLVGLLAEAMSAVASPAEALQLLEQARSAVRPNEEAARRLHSVLLKKFSDYVAAGRNPFVDFEAATATELVFRANAALREPRPAGTSLTLAELQRLLRAWVEEDAGRLVAVLRRIAPEGRLVHANQSKAYVRALVQGFFGDPADLRELAVRLWVDKRVDDPQGLIGQLVEALTVAEWERNVASGAPAPFSPSPGGGVPSAVRPPQDRGPAPTD
jgi:KAP family P-loop domain